MPKVHVEEVTLEEGDVLDINLPDGHVLSVYSNGEIAVEANDYPYTEYSVNVVSKVKKAHKKELKDLTHV